MCFFCCLLVDDNKWRSCSDLGCGHSFYHPHTPNKTEIVAVNYCTDDTEAKRFSRYKALFSSRPPPLRRQAIDIEMESSPNKSKFYVIYFIGI